MTAITLPPTAYGLATRGLARAWDRRTPDALEIWLGWLEGSASIASRQYAPVSRNRSEAR